MKHKIFLLVGCCVFLLAAGCTTTSSYTHNQGLPPLGPSDKFAIGTVEDKATYQFEEEGDVFNLSDKLHHVLGEELAKAGLFASDGNYVINSVILEYAPGNAWMRGMLLSQGATRLKVACQIVDNAGNSISSLLVERSITVGGGFTIGAFRYVFQEVGEEVVRLIKLEIAKTDSNF